MMVGLQSNAKLEVCMCARTRTDFNLALANKHPEKKDINHIKDAANSIDATHAEATRLEDKIMIFKQIEQMEGGFDLLNETVSSALKTWVKGEFNKFLDD